MIWGVPNYNKVNIKKINNLVTKNGVNIFLEYFSFLKLQEHATLLKQILLSSARGPLSIGMLDFLRRLEMVKIKKKEKLKNRDFI